MLYSANLVFGLEGNAEDNTYSDPTSIYITKLSLLPQCGLKLEFWFKVFLALVASLITQALLGFLFVKLYKRKLTKINLDRENPNSKY